MTSDPAATVEPTHYTSPRSMRGGARILSASIRGFATNADQFLSTRLRKNLIDVAKELELLGGQD